MVTHPDLPPNGWLGVSRSRLVALQLVPGRMQLLTTPGTVGEVVPLDRVRRRGRRVWLGGRKVRLVGAGDFAGERLGKDVSSGFFDGSVGAGNDPISAVLGLIELVVMLVAAPFAIAGAIGRWSRGRSEARRLAAALAGAS